MRIVFMGTPDFAVAPLKALAHKHDVVAVFSQPDRPKGRGKKLTKTAVKIAAESLEIPVYQYQDINRDDEAKNVLAQIAPDIIIVVAFGQILKPWILDLPKYGCLNIHASLLPRWRGASPIQTAILHGDRLSGVTIIQMDKGLDTGDILHAKSLAITDTMTGSELHDKLMPLGAQAITETLDMIENNGDCQAIKQENAKSTYAPLITKTMLAVEWSNSTEDICNQIRAYNAWPVASTAYQNTRFKLYKAHPVNIESAACPGEIIDVTKNAIIVKTGDGTLSIDELQAVNSKRMPVADYLRGHQVNIGEVLG